MRSSIAALVIMLAVSAAVPASDAIAQDTAHHGWERVLDLPSGEVYSATFATGDVAWAVGPGGIFRSEDRGHSWQIAHTSSTLLTQIAAAPGGQQGWATGIVGTLLYTADGGRSWSARDAGSDLNLGAIAALDADTAIVAGAGYGVSDVPSEPEPHTVRRTDDAGVTWRELDVAGYRASDMDFIDSQHGWIAGVRCDAPPPQPFLCETRSYAVVTTSDGGNTWRIVNEGAEFTALAFVSSDHGWGVRRGCPEPSAPARCVATIATTDDGGETWTDVRDMGVPGRSAVAAFDARMLLAVETLCNEAFTDCREQLIETRDSGASWAVVDPPAPAFTSAFAFAPAGHGLRVTSQTISTTEDRRAWMLATFPITAGTGAYDFIDAQTGWFAASQLLRTTDAGATWESVGDLRPVDLEFVSETEGWASTLAYDPASETQRVTLQHTTDAGRTWTEQYSRAFGNYLYLHFADARNGWAYSLYDALLLRTRDGGVTWYQQPLPVDVDGNAPVIAFVDARTAWLVEPVCVNYNDNCVIRPWLSRDGGDTWRRAADIPYPDGCPLDLGAASADAAWISAAECRQFARPYILRTTDGGATWRRTDLGVTGEVGPLTFFGPLVGRAIEAVCDEPPGPCTDTLLRTEDGGITWTRTPTGLSESYTYNYEFVAPERAWRLLQTGGGLFSVSRHQLYRFAGPGSGQPPLAFPYTGSGGEGRRVAGARWVLLLAAAAAAAATLRRRPR